MIILTEYDNHMHSPGNFIGLAVVEEIILGQNGLTPIFSHVKYSTKKYLKSIFSNLILIFTYTIYTMFNKLDLYEAW